MLERIKYSEHNWKIGGGLKIVHILLGQQSAFTKYSCSYAYGTTEIVEINRNKKLAKEIPRTWIKQCFAQVISNPRFPFHQLHIKISLMKQLVKSLNKGDTCFLYYSASKFPTVTDAKLKKGFLDGPQMRKILNEKLLSSMRTRLKEQHGSV